MKTKRRTDVQQNALAVHIAPLPRCSGCGRKTPRHMEYQRGGKTVRVALCGECARADDGAARSVR